MEIQFLNLRLKYSVVDPHESALIWLSWIGIADPDPGAWKFNKNNKESKAW
jgi:hypothetical protein